MKSTSSVKNRYLVASAVLIAAAYLLRIWGLTDTSLWYDEVFVLTHAQQGPVAAVMGLLKEDNALPVHGLLTALWVSFTGSGEFTARYLSVLLGTITTPLIIRLSGTLSQTRYGGYGSAIAYATLPIFIYYTQEVRMYALAIPLSTTFAWVAIRLYKTGKNAVLYPSIGILMLSTHIYTGFLWVVTLVWGLIDAVTNTPTQKKRVAFVTWLRANAIMALGTLPIAVWAVWRVNTDATATSSIPLEVLRWIPVSFGIGQFIPSPWAEVFMLTTALSLCIGYIRLIYQRNYTGVVWSILMLTLPLLLLICATLVKAKWSERYLLPSFGLGVVTSVGLGWDIIWNNSRKLVRIPFSTSRLKIISFCLMAVWLAGSLPAVIRQTKGTHALGIQDEWHPRPDFRGAAHYIDENDSPEDAIVVVAGYAAHTLEYYYDGPAKLIGLPQNTHLLNTNEIIDLHALQILEEETLGYKTLWLILWQHLLSDPTNLIESILVASCSRLPVSESFTNLGVLRFDLTDCRPLDKAVVPSVLYNVEFSTPIQLKGYDIQKQPGLWVVSLWWKNTGTIDENYTVFVHLVNPAGEIVTQHDHIAGADAYPTSQWREGTYLRNRFYLEVAENTCDSCVLNIGLYTDDNRVLLKNNLDTIVIETDK